MRACVQRSADFELLWQSIMQYKVLAVLGSVGYHERFLMNYFLFRVFCSTVRSRESERQESMFHFTNCLQCWH